MKGFLTHLVSYPHPILRFKDVLPHHCEDYIEKIMSSDASNSWKYDHIHVLQKLFQYRGVMKDGLVIDPLKGELAANIVSRNAGSSFESKTQIIPEEILGPLVRESLQYVDQLADYLLDASDKMQQVRMGKTRGHIEYSRTRCLHQHSSSVYPLAGTRLEHGLRSLRKLSKELECLQTACFVLIAFATGMRLSELLSLREGCCEVETQSGRPDLVWIHSRVFKMQGLPDGRKAKWLGGPLCAKAVQVLEQLGRSVRAVEVKGGGDDVARRFVAQLKDVFAEVGLDRRDAVLFQVVVDVQLLADHRLALGDGSCADPLADGEHGGAGLVGGARPVDLAAGALDVRRERFEIEVEIGERVVLDLLTDLAQPLELRQGGDSGGAAGGELRACASQRLLQAGVRHGVRGVALEVRTGREHRHPPGPFQCNHPPRRRQGAEGRAPAFVLDWHFSSCASGVMVAAIYPRQSRVAARAWRRAEAVRFVS